MGKGVINMKMSKCIIGTMLIGSLSVGSFVLGNATEKLTTVDGKEVIQAYNNLVNQNGVEHLILTDINGTTMDIYRNRSNGSERVDFFDEDGMLVDRTITTDYGATFLTLAQYQTNGEWQIELLKTLPPENALGENKELMQKSMIDGYFQEEFVDGVYRDWKKSEIDTKTNLIKYSDESNNIYIDSNTGEVAKREILVDGEVIKTFNVEILSVDKVRPEAMFQMDAPLIKPNSIANNKKLRTLINELEVTTDDCSNVEYAPTDGKG